MPASEVRRRGTRLRRRNTALATAGGVLAIAVIAAPLAVLANNHSGADTTPPPATNTPSPTVTWVQEIPADFDLSAGMGAKGTAVTSDREPVVSESICGVVWTMVHTPQDQLSSSMENAGSEGGLERHLVVFADADEATAELEQFREAPSNCDGVYSDEGFAYEMIPATAADSSAEEAAAWVQALHGDAGLTGEGYITVAQQVGNAVLIDRAVSGGVGDEDVRRNGVDNLLERDTQVIEAMCVFSATGCGSSDHADDPTVSEGAVPAVPADFPLDSGLPSGGLDGTGPCPTPTSCGRTAAKPNVVEVARAQSRSVSEIRDRRLMTFAREADAQAYVESVAEL
jgi:hypothetical protein